MLEVVGQFAVAFGVGWVTYHLLMHRAYMMRSCCRQHYKTHATCKCIDCVDYRGDE